MASVKSVSQEGLRQERSERSQGCEKFQQILMSVVGKKRGDQKEV